LVQKTTLIVVRHGESDANRRRIISAKMVDHSLTALGLQQAQETAGNLKTTAIDLIFSSTRQRAIHTAQAVNKFHNAQMVLSHDLIERDYGMFSGMPKTEAHQIMKEKGFGWLEIPQSETVVEMDTRVARVVAKLTKEHSGKSILVSTHEDVIRAFFRILDGKSPLESASLHIENSQPYEFYI